MRCLLALFLAFAAAGCTQTHTLATCKGPLVALNAPHWQPTAGDMIALDRVCPEDR